MREQDGSIMVDQAQRKAVGLPEELTFKTRPELGWQMIQRVRDGGVPYPLFLRSLS